MKRANIIIGLIALLGVSACTKVEPGFVGIKVNNYGDQKGVEDFPLVTGRVHYNPWTEDIYKFPTFMQNVVWTADKREGSPVDQSISFNSVEGEPMRANVALSYQIESTKVPDLFIEFRKPVDHITDVYMRSKIRDAFTGCGATRRVMSIIGENRAEFIDCARGAIEKELGPKGFTFDQVSIIGDIGVSQKVREAISQALQATQRAIQAENEVRQTKAEAEQARQEAQGIADSKVIAAEGQAKALLVSARAQAEANKVVRQSVSAELIQWEATQRWDGVLPRVTGDAVPMIQIAD